MDGTGRPAIPPPESPVIPAPPVAPTPLRELAALFLKLGITAFGGLPSHIALMHRSVVSHRKWLTQQEFLDMVGSVNLSPGPGSTEMAIEIGMARAGWRGAFVAGVCFFLPGALIVLALAMAYSAFGGLPIVRSVLYGIKPVMIGIVLYSLWILLRAVVKGPGTAATVVMVMALAFLGVSEVLVLALAALVTMVWANRRRFAAPGGGPLVGVLAWLRWPGHWMSVAAEAGRPEVLAAPFSMAVLFLECLKLGSLLFGSGYVLLAIARTDFVAHWHWMTDRQLLDAVVIGQITPGPVYTCATFIGFLLGGFPGAAIATVGVFLPAFVFVPTFNFVVPWMRKSPWAGAALDGLNAACIGLIAVVLWHFGRAALEDGWCVALAALALAAAFRGKIPYYSLVLGGGLAGLIIHFAKHML